MPSGRKSKSGGSICLRSPNFLLLIYSNNTQYRSFSHRLNEIDEICKSCGSEKTLNKIPVMFEYTKEIKKEKNISEDEAKKIANKILEIN